MYSSRRNDARGIIIQVFFEIKYFKQEPIQGRFDFSDVLYFGWPNQPSSGTMRVYIDIREETYYISVYYFE